MGHIVVEIWPRWVTPVNRRGRSTLGLDDSVRGTSGFLRETECEKRPLIYTKTWSPILFACRPGGTRSQRLCGPPTGNQAIKQPTNQPAKAVNVNQGRFSREETVVCRVQASGGRALAQTLFARSGPVPELLPQPESVNMILLLSRAETLTCGRQGLGWPGYWPTLATRGSPDEERHAPAGRETAANSGHQTSPRGKERRNAGNEWTRRRC